MWRNWFHPYLVISVVLGSVVATSPAQVQGSVDPIGELKKTSTFDRVQGVNVGKSSKGKVVCFFEEEGSTEILSIGISTDGAFIRVESDPDRLPNESNTNTALPLWSRTNPKPPVRIFAGKQVTKLVDGHEKYTDDYEPLQIYGGAVDYVPNIKTIYGDGFVLLAKGDAKSFFEMVVRAGREYIVVQSVSEPKNLDGVVGAYRFKASTISALLSCAKKHIH
jgi:hypothetical protein